ncbi:transglutaminase-like domain-containing protein [Ketobacter alkanivorans]|uniref:Cysteine protease n=1 Tax=Ketobacter alkanivorans TaxID=1917421 RepID=A0A2K9LKT5_9GAMM|nr:transglutaminase family protein [Ketobacter alkanivorans]AUM12938.1 cysteine protease [Ketobacter alkanivorans]MCP5016016.1 transglutaminase family protein [Ketobacter sp.]
MWLRTSCELNFVIDMPTPFILMLRPRSGAQQWISSEEYLLYPSVPAFEFTDDYGNLCQRLVAPVGDFTVYTSAKIMTADYVDRDPGGMFVDVQSLPDSVLKYLLPSRYCESDRFGDMATEIVAGQLPGYDQVEKIERWLYQNISFIPGSSSVPLSAAEVNIQQSGVCRDLAHLGVALCRSLSIPARFVVGYLHGLEPMELHAWFEAYVAGRWYIFDATQSFKKGGYVSIGYGRDAADVAVYNQFGPAVYPVQQKVCVDSV